MRPDAAVATTLYFPTREELEMFKEAAAAEGKPLTAWLRDLARPRAAEVLATRKRKCPTCGASHRRAPKRKVAA
jgi:hypothetical protein